MILTSFYLLIENQQLVPLILKHILKHKHCVFEK
jgi:hypothetical protein